MTKEHSPANGSRVVLLYGGKYRISLLDPERASPESLNFRDYKVAFQSSLLKTKKELAVAPTRRKFDGRLRPMNEYNRILKDRKAKLEQVEKALLYLNGQEQDRLRLIEVSEQNGKREVIGFQLIYNSN